MSCGTRAQESRPGDPDGAWLLRSSLWVSHPAVLRTGRGAPPSQPAPSPLPAADFPVRAPQPAPSPRYCSLTCCCPAVRLCRALLSLWATRETIPMQPPNVYSSHHRFCDVRGRGNLLRISREASSTVKARPPSGSNPLDAPPTGSARPAPRSPRLPATSPARKAPGSWSTRRASATGGWTSWSTTRASSGWGRCSPPARPTTRLLWPR